MKTLNDAGNELVANINYNLTRRKHTKSLENSIVLMTWQVIYKDMVSNSHSAPRNGVQNFTMRDHLPKGYPGWEGRIWLVLKNHTNTGTGNLFANTFGHTGSGGSGYPMLKQEFTGAVALITNDDVGLNDYYPLSWDFRMFADDIPGVYKHEQKDFIEHRINALLTHDNTPEPLQPIHKFIYVNEDIINELNSKTTMPTRSK